MASDASPRGLITQSPDHSITQSLRSSKPALVAYLTCGDPDVLTSRAAIIAALDAGADLIELGVPFSDPVADGPVIQRASERALKNRTSLRDVIEMAAGVVRERPAAQMIIFSYLNPVLRFGLEKFADELKKAGIAGALITDLTVEEAGEYLRVMRQNELDTVFLAAPTSTDQRLKAIAEASTGFVYAVSRTGITGAREQLSEEARGLVERIRKFTRLPVALGFGISTPAQFAEVAGFADAVVVGSAIVRIFEEHGADAPRQVGEFVRQLKSAVSATGTGTAAR